MIAARPTEPRRAAEEAIHPSNEHGPLTPPPGADAGGSNESRWLLLIHQIPPRPGYLRVKIWRRLQRLGAVAIKNSVYVLPRNESAYEDFEWIVREIAASGGEVSAVLVLVTPLTRFPLPLTAVLPGVLFTTSVITARRSQTV